jgi:hypothetical protein
MLESVVLTGTVSATGIPRLSTDSKETKTMSTITLNDLPESTELDVAALKAVTGGFLESMVAYAPREGSYLPSINNYLIQYEQNIFQQNPTNITIMSGPTGGNVVNNISTNSLTAASPMSFTRISGVLDGLLA